MALKIDPNPAALSNQLKVLASPLKMSFAKMGINVLNGITNKLLIVSIKIRLLNSLSRETYLKPSCNSSQILACEVVCGVKDSFIMDKQINTGR
ncbi:hypothetical protein D3C78_1712230 [compost metagenome]